MKKVIIISTLFLMSVVATSVAQDLNAMTDNLVNLSSGVSGNYFSNASAAATNDATDFAITTGHAQGGYAYATGSFTTSIYRKEIAGEKFVAGTDLLQDPGTVYNTSVLSTWDAI
ncbi:hypothetical protein ACFLZU_03295 [Thermodesulfobacteriota bacterium]